jgi:hypothetical protein
MELRVKTRVLALTASAVAIASLSSAANAHLVQFGWKDNGAGGVTLYGEHWHGDLTSAYSANGGIHITPVSFSGPTITAQWNSVINNATTASLGLTGSQCDPGNAGCDSMQDWMVTVPIALGNGTYDFITGPNCCIDTMTSPVRVTVTGVTSVPPGTIGNSGVPEPATWAMMLFGFGAVGFAMRRRRNETRVRYSFA